MFTDSMATCTDEAASCASSCDDTDFMMTYCRDTCGRCPDTGERSCFSCRYLHATDDILVVPSYLYLFKLARASLVLFLCFFRLQSEVDILK